MGKFEEWKERWTAGDTTFIPDLFDYAEDQASEILRLQEYELMFTNLEKEVEDTRIMLENKRIHDQRDLIKMQKEGLISTDEYWTRFNEDQAFERFMSKMDKQFP